MHTHSQAPFATKGKQGLYYVRICNVDEGGYRVKGHEGKRKGEEEEVKIVVDG